MAKRFTDTDKWRMAWFRKLGSEGRDIWNYIHDNCDFAGFFEIDCERLSFELGIEVTLDRIKSVLNGKYIIVADDRIFLPSFIQFQYGELSEASKPHVAVIKKLKNQRVWEEYTSGIQTTKDKDKEKDQDQDKDKEKEEAPTPQRVSDSSKFESRFKFDFPALFDLYPRQEKKSISLAVMSEKIQTQATYDECRASFLNYRKHCEQNSIEKRFILTCPSFFEEWRDWLDPNNGSSLIKSNKEKSIAELIAEKKAREASA